MTRIVDHAAKVAHEVNRAYCQALGDHSQPISHIPKEQQAKDYIFRAVVLG